MAYGYAGQVAARRPEQRVKASDVRAVQFGKPPFGRRGYDEIEVDDFLRKVTDALAQARGVPPLDPEEVHQVAFRKPRLGSRGYDEDEVDAFLDLVEAELRWRSSPEGQAEMAGPAGGGGIGGGGGAGSGYAPPAGMVGLSGGPGAVAPAGPAVRAVTVALLADRGRMLVTEMADPTTGRTAYRPPGGEIAFGERGHEAVRRTMGETRRPADRGAADGDAGEHPPLRRRGRARAGAGLRGGDRGPAGVVAAAAAQPARRRHRDLGAGGHVPPQRGPVAAGRAAAAG